MREVRPSIETSTQEGRLRAKTAPQLRPPARTVTDLATGVALNEPRVTSGPGRVRNSSPWRSVPQAVTTCHTGGTFDSRDEERTIKAHKQFCGLVCPGKERDAGRSEFRALPDPGPVTSEKWVFHDCGGDAEAYVPSICCLFPSNVQQWPTSAAARLRHGCRGRRIEAERSDAPLRPSPSGSKHSRFSEKYNDAIAGQAYQTQLGRLPEISMSVAAAEPDHDTVTLRPSGPPADRPVPREIRGDLRRPVHVVGKHTALRFRRGGDGADTARSEERTLARIPSNPDVAFPGAWTPECRARTKELTAGRAAVRGTSPEDPAFHHDFLVANRRFFGAPCAVYLCMDQTLGTWSIFDLGAICQSITLAAQDRGVDRLSLST
jgi:hypothetical protein